MHQTRLLLACIAMIAFAACKKSQPKPKTPEEILSSGKWQEISMVQNYNGPDTNFSFNYYDIWQDCQKDNYVIFHTDKLVTSDEGPTKCHPNSPQTQTSGKWQLLDNGSKLMLTNIATSQSGTQIVKELTEQSLVLWGETSDGSSTESITSVYKKIH